MTNQVPFSLTVNSIRAAHAVSGVPGGNVKTAYSVRGSDWDGSLTSSSQFINVVWYNRASVNHKI